MDEQVSAASGLTTGLPVGAVRWRNRYWDADNRSRRSRSPVPVDEFGRISGTGWRCPKCRVPRWLPLPRGKAPGQPVAPVCEVHDRKMLPLRLQRPPLLPYRELWSVLERPLRPVWALPALAAAGFAVDAAPVPALAVAGSAPLVWVVARRLFRRERIAWHVAHNNLDADDPQAHKRLRAAIDRAARKVGYAAGAGAGWLALPAALGVDPGTWAGRMVWSALGLVWLPPAATWWWMDRHRETPRQVEPEPVPTDDSPQMDPEEAEVMRRWRAKVAMRKGDVVDQAADGRPVLADRDGRLAGANLTNWQRVRGGWQAIIRGPIGDFESDQFTQAKGKIASTFSVGKSMVTVMPDPDDENVATLLVQRAAVVREEVRWAGPDSIDVKSGRAPLVQYVDGTIGMYELYRPGWGVPHEFYCGTTGSGKSEALNAVFAIDRWAHYQGRGLVCDFLIDPQEGQSFGAFAENLAAPVASEFDEAMLLAEAFRREMKRRNRYLSRVEWIDEKGRKRRGRKWWDPLLDGPLLCLNIDEAHEFLAFRAFALLITSGARMFRKCGGKIRVATHTPLLADLGGSMALRDMLTGGASWVGRTANSLSGPVAFNGRLPADPRSLPEIGGACFYLSAHEKRSMVARTMWEPDYYDWVRDDADEPVGYPGVLPAETLDAFGPEYARWVAAAGSGADWQPELPLNGAHGHAAAEVPDRLLVAAVLDVLVAADGPLDMAGLDVGLRAVGVAAATLQVRAALRVLRDRGLVLSADGRHEATPAGREEVAMAVGGVAA